MTKHELKHKADRAVEETKSALQTVYDALNQGQKKKIVKDDAVKALFERYGVDIEK